MRFQRKSRLVSRRASTTWASSQARNSRVILSIMYSWAHVPTVVLKTSVLSLLLVKGKKKAEGVTAWLVPGSWLVDKQIREEGIDKIVEAAGFEIRQPGCSACLGNER